MDGSLFTTVISNMLPELVCRLFLGGHILVCICIWIFTCVRVLSSVWCTWIRVHVCRGPCWYQCLLQSFSALYVETSHLTELHTHSEDSLSLLPKRWDSVGSEDHILVLRLAGQVLSLISYLPAIIWQCFVEEFLYICEKHQEHLAMVFFLSCIPVWLWYLGTNDSVEFICKNLFIVNFLECCRMNWC